MKSCKDLEVWQKAMDLVVDSYNLAEMFPMNEKYGLTSQVQRAAVSVPANIAEGRSRQHTKEFIQFISIAYGSLAELETLIEIADRLDYVSNNLIPTLPRGLGVEVMSFAVLKKAWQEDDNPAWREHVTLFIKRNIDKFKLSNVANSMDYSYMRWTVDTPEDLAFIRKIYGYYKNKHFNWKDVLSLLVLHPEWMEINRNIQQKTVI